MICKNCMWYNTKEFEGACEILTRRSNDGLYYIDEESDCVIPNERECCTNCRLKAKLKVWDYSAPHVPKYSTPGYVCMLFADEGSVVQMIGCNPDYGMCECFSLKEKKNDDC